MGTKQGPGKTRTFNGERFRRPTRKFYKPETAENVARGHRSYGRKARIVRVKCPKGRKAAVVYVRGGRR